MNFIYAKYFDGVSSRTYDVKVELDHKFLIISGTDEKDNIHDIWPVKDLKNMDFSSSNELHFHFGEFPQKSLVITGDHEFEQIKLKYPDLFKGDMYHRVLKGKPVKVFIVSLIVLVFIMSLYFLVIAPFIAEKAVNIVPKSQEIALGDKMFHSMESYLSIDKEKSKELDSFYKALNFQDDYPVNLYYSNTGEINAFAIPGGKIVIYKGLLDKIDSWQQLAGLIAHELAHVEQRHSLKSLSRSLSTYIIISVITTDISGITSVFIDNAFKLERLSNSRSFETEADNIGFDIVVQSKINPRGLLELMEILDNYKSLKLHGTSKTIFRILSTHPVTEDRIKNLKRKIDNLPDTNFVDNKNAEILFDKLKK